MRDETAARAGSKALLLLGTPRVLPILKDLDLKDGPLSRQELRVAAEFPPESSLRNLLNALIKNDVVVRHRQDSPPRASEFHLTDAGRELLTVADELERWLQQAPGGPRPLGTNAAKAAVRGIVEGWSATILIRLAGGPLSLTQLDKVVPTSSYPKIERALVSMRVAGQLDVGPRGNRGMPYTLNEWIRRGFGPLALAARWEHRNKLEGVAPVRRLDLESACTIVSPVLDLPTGLAGTFEAAVPAKGRGRLRATIEVRDGRVSMTADGKPSAAPDAGASGTVDAWFSAVTDGDLSGLQLNGSASFVHEVVDCLRRSLFASGEVLAPG